MLSKAQPDFRDVDATADDSLAANTSRPMDHNEGLHEDDTLVDIFSGTHLPQTIQPPEGENPIDTFYETDIPQTISPIEAKNTEDQQWSSSVSHEEILSPSNSAKDSSRFGFALNTWCNPPSLIALFRGKSRPKARTQNRQATGSESPILACGTANVELYNNLESSFNG